ncbi:hypothetical protein PPSIR1_30150 [Plesiocystis pacifica SIR-1]|uniref:Uncharacterized protein n=2 Tax=Plesiocystis pacifica TaxID=191768 RepID=A6FZ09_9BACT|nr:hypothetical protein PPSIR1_30150 [Plesiocystis pacifica SIR-1]
MTTMASVFIGTLTLLTLAGAVAFLVHDERLGELFSGRYGHAKRVEAGALLVVLVFLLILVTWNLGFSQSVL